MTKTRRANQMLVGDQRKLVKLVDAFCLEWGAARTGEPYDAYGKPNSGEWTLDTTIGRLSVRCYGNWIACRWEDMKTAAERLGTNPFSGKWNFHYDRVTADSAFRTFTDSIGRFAPPEPTCAICGGSPDSSMHSSKYHGSEVANQHEYEAS